MEKTLLKRKVVILPANKKVVIGDFVIASYDERAILNGVDVKGKLFCGVKVCEPTVKQSYYHLYILGGKEDGDIKEGDWYIVELFKVTGEYDGLHFEQCKSLTDGIWINKPEVNEIRHIDNCKKIIVATDKSLRLPQPSQSFIDVLIKVYNNGTPIEYVNVDYEPDLPFTCNSEGVRNYPNIKIDEQNTITIHKLKDSYTREELKPLFKEAIENGCKYTSVDDFIEQNF